ADRDRRQQCQSRDDQEQPIPNGRQAQAPVGVWRGWDPQATNGTSPAPPLGRAERSRQKYRARRRANRPEGLYPGHMLRFGAPPPLVADPAARRPGGGGTAMSQTLYERLAGKTAITAVIDDFVARCAADARING